MWRQPAIERNFDQLPEAFNGGIFRRNCVRSPPEPLRADNINSNPVAVEISLPNGDTLLNTDLLRHTALAFLFCSLCYTSGVNADQAYYRWTDAQGNMKISDRLPPQGVEYEKISTGASFHRPKFDDPAPSETSQTDAKKPGNASAASDAKNAEPKKPEFKKNPEVCERAKANLETLNTNARIRMRNDDGEFTYIDEAQKEAQKKAARDSMKRHCE